MFNVNLREWIAIGMYSIMPCSRWSHCMTTNGTRNDGFLIFGGVNLRSYCKSKVYQFTILNNWITSKDPEHIDEKLEILSNNCKEKIEIIKNVIKERK